MMLLEAELVKAYGKGSDAFRLEAKLSLREGELAGLIGESGAGKSTLLRLLAGLLRPDEGFIRVNGTVWYDSSAKIFLPPQRRRTGFVFQEPALFPNMSVRENLRYAAGGRGKEELRIGELMEAAGLSTLADRRPSALSGGQKQRAALVRALVRGPELLLLDEPFNALDIGAREEMQSLLFSLREAYGTGGIWVSHEEAALARLCDRRFRMKAGKLDAEEANLTTAGTPGSFQAIFIRQEGNFWLLDHEGKVIRIPAKAGIAPENGKIVTFFIADNQQDKDIKQDNL